MYIKNVMKRGLNTCSVTVGMATFGLDVHGNCIAVLVRAMTINLALIINSVVVLTGTGIHVNAIIDQVNIQLKRIR